MQKSPPERLNHLQAHMQVFLTPEVKGPTDLWSTIHALGMPLCGLPQAPPPPGLTW